MDHIREVVQGRHPGAVVADIRTREEYDGLSAPYSYIPEKGRIKGALWGHAGDGPWTMESYVSPDDTIRDLKEIEAMWAKEGITKDKEVSFYCGTSWRSSLTFFLARAMGWKHVKNFDGSWYEWSMGPETPGNSPICANHLCRSSDLQERQTAFIILENYLTAVRIASSFKAFINFVSACGGNSPSASLAGRYESISPPL